MEVVQDCNSMNNCYRGKKKKIELFIYHEFDIQKKGVSFWKVKVFKRKTRGKNTSECKTIE